MTKLRILLAEDDADVRLTTTLVLQRHDYDVTAASDGNEAWEFFCSSQEDSSFDACVFDVAMPKLDGVSLTKKIREQSDVPIILLTARDLAIDQVTGLEAGADDYVLKPFNSDILNARIRAVLRRNNTRSRSEQDDHRIVLGDVTIDTKGMSVTNGKSETTLTVTEMRLLEALIQRRGEVLDRNTLLEIAWGSRDGFEVRVVDVTIQRLRAKIGNDAILTVRGAGYKLVEQ